MGDLSKCGVASKIEYDECVKRQGELEKSVKQVNIALENVKDPAFTEMMQKFESEASLKLSTLRQETERVAELTKRILELFAEKPKTPLAEMLVKLEKFRKDFENARRENLLAKAKKE